MNFGAVFDWAKGHSAAEVALVRACLKFLIPGQRLAALFDLLAAVALLLGDEGAKEVQATITDLKNAGLKPP